LRGRMLKRYLKFTGLVWLLLAIVSQSFAAVGPSCEILHSETKMTANTSPTMMAMDGMSHSHHSTSAVSDHSAPSDCCNEQTCSMLNCVSLPAMAVASQLRLRADAPLILHVNYTAAYTGIEPVSFYRPPITH
jgi:hypothetical protein